MLLRQLKTFASVEEVRAPLRGRLNQVNRAFAKRVKILLGRWQREHYDDLESKTLGEQQRMIRFERNRSQRTGARMLQVEKLPEYSKHFGAIFNFRHDFAYETSTETPPTAEMVNILSESGICYCQHALLTHHHRIFCTQEKGLKSGRVLGRVSRADEASGGSGRRAAESGGRDHVLYWSLSGIL